MVCENTVAGLVHPCIEATTSEPVFTSPIFQPLFFAAAGSVVHVLDATMLIEKLPDEKSLGGDAGLETLPHPAIEMNSSTPAARRVVSAIKCVSRAGGWRPVSYIARYFRGVSAIPVILALSSAIFLVARGKANERNVMKRLASVGGFIFISFLAPTFGSAQTPSPDNIYVLQARPRQPTTTAPLTLTFSEPCGQGRTRKARQTEITIAAGDVIDSLTIPVRAHKFEYDSLSESLFVLDVRDRKIPGRSTDPLVFTLASGTVVRVPSSCIHAEATRWLRVNLPSEAKVSAATSSVGEPTTSHEPCRADQSPAADGSSVQFDAKGDFSSWLRRFVAQVRRNWFVPESVRTARGCVVVTFLVHKSGAISDVTLLKPSSVDTFNKSAFGAVIASNPTYQLPAEYPEESAFFTVTFYFNENPEAAKS